MGETVPVGYRFHPTDEELVGHYLKYKLLGDHSRVYSISEVDVCKFEPWDLPAFSKVKSDDLEWFFFSPRNLKYSNSSRSNRATNSGYWKVTGKDRNIMTRGTNNVIGIKKTLVFYKGRLPGVRTNWVIHEYHAVTFPADMRTFVLCRLKLNAEKKPDGRFDELRTEGVTIAADPENQVTSDRIPDVFTLPGPEVTLEQIFPAPPQQEEYDFPSLHYSPIGTDQEQFQDSSIFTEICFGNEQDIRQFASDTTEDEDNVDSFLNSILVDEDVIVSEERRDAVVNDSSYLLSLREVYYESSETDIELVSAKYSNTCSSTSACKHAVSSGYQHQVTEMVDTSQDAVYAGTFSVSPKTEVNEERKDSTFGDNFWGLEISSDSTVKENISSPSPLTASSSTSRRSKTKSDNFTSRRAAPRRSQTQRKVSSKAGSGNEVQKETHILESNTDKRKAQNVRSRKNLETTSNQSSNVNGKCSFMHLETPSLSHNPNPRSVFLVNVIIGFSLLIVTTWDMLSYGKLG